MMARLLARRIKGMTVDPVHLYDSNTDAGRPRLVLNQDLQEFIWNYSTLRRLRLCSKRFPCRGRFCPWCSRRITRATREAIRPATRRYVATLDVTLTTRSTPDLASAWQRQEQVRKRFLSHRWLTSRCEGWMRETEIAHSEAGWHVHDHLLVFDDPEALADLVPELIGRWRASASEAGVAVSRLGQFPKVRSDVWTRVLYATKGQFAASRRPKRSRNLDSILAGFRAGDADDADRWAEIETLFGGGRRRWRATGGSLRPGVIASHKVR
jgi:hypothetical protein